MSLNPLRNIPSVNDLLESPPLRRLVERLSHNLLVSTVRSVLDEVRTEVQHAATDLSLPSISELAERVARRVAEVELSPLRPLINATGILLPPGLGRAPLADEALRAASAVAHDYASLELDLSTGLRSPRTGAVQSLLRQLTGAEAAIVVNNNAAAVLLALATLATGREVLVSRGNLAEIGDSFRLPELIAASGATLREVGTTNKTRASDYLDAIGDLTAAMFLVHSSEFAMLGATQSVSLEELVEIGRRRQIPIIHDIGSGALIDLAPWGLSGEPVALQSIEAGADLVSFSGDKLLGGPQCGIVVGRRGWIERIERHPLARALRIDKPNLAALEATLRLYRDPDKARRQIPLLQLLCTSVDNLKNRAERLAPQMAAAAAVASAQAEPTVACLRENAVPTQQLPSWAIALVPKQGTVSQLAASLRTASPCVVGRPQEGRLLLDLRGVLPRQDQDLVRAVELLPPPSA